MDIFSKTPQQRRWTRLAVECYNRGCRCNGCYYQTFFTQPDYYYNYEKGLSQKCQMKRTVLELVKTLGKPDEKNTSASITKEIIVELYEVQKIPLSEIYKRLRVDKYEFEELLRGYNIPQRKRPKHAKHIGG